MKSLGSYVAQSVAILLTSYLCSREQLILVARVIKELQKLHCQYNEQPLQQFLLNAAAYVSLPRVVVWTSNFWSFLATITVNQFLLCINQRGISTRGAFITLALKYVNMQVA